jgi:hypothetical protein
VRARARLKCRQSVGVAIPCLTTSCLCSANPPVAEINLLNKQWQYSSYVLNNTTPSADK